MNIKGPSVEGLLGWSQANYSCLKGEVRNNLVCSEAHARCLVTGKKKKKSILQFLQLFFTLCCLILGMLEKRRGCCSHLGPETLCTDWK